MSSKGGMAIQDGQTVVFIGDSITDCGQRDTCAPLGNGYLYMISALITARYPQRNIRIINKGIGGQVCPDLQDRWEDDVIAYKPDWVSVLIGINDLHRQLCGDDEAALPDLYYQAYTQCLESTVENTSAKLILMDPFYISRSTDPHSHRSVVLEKLPEYIDIVGKLAEKFGAIHIRLHDVFQEILKYKPTEYICNEPVHPNQAGHLIIAHEWLKAVGW